MTREKTIRKVLDKVWTTAVQQAHILEQAKKKAWTEAYDSFKAEYENRLKTDMVAMLTEIQLEMDEEKKEVSSMAMVGGLSIAKTIIQQKITNLQVNNSKVKEQKDGE